MPLEDGPKAGKGVFVGLFLVALASLMYEILLTRLFSVTLYYHFAFLAVSMALFGMTVGATLVCLMPAFFQPKTISKRLAQAALLFSLAAVVHLLFLTQAPATMGLRIYLSLNYVFGALPFVCSGLIASLILSHFKSQLGKLYAADLIGSALGCFGLIAVFFLADGLMAVVFVAALASLAAFFFVGWSGGRLGRVALVLMAVMSLVGGLGSFASSRQRPWLHLNWMKTPETSPSLYEKWNDFSRLRVSDDWQEQDDVKQLRLNIDASAATSLTSFDGDLDKVAFLKRDITNVGFMLKPQGDALIVGAGGGRDVLSALAYGLRSVKAVEINEDIIRIVNQVYGGLTGHLDERPDVRFVNDEARSYVARSGESYDVIQVSLIDTWAATAAGAFSLTENALYTKEGWGIFLDHLKPGGVMTFTRWFFRSHPGEIYRLAALASESLKAEGVADPRAHIVVMIERPKPGEDPESYDCRGTMIVARDALTADDLTRLDDFAQKNGHEIILDPYRSDDETLVLLASGAASDDWFQRNELDLTAPTDDRPFFFNMLRFRDALNSSFKAQGMNTQNMNAATVLIQLLLLVVVLSLICILWPAFFALKKIGKRQLISPSLIFLGIGFGFMLVEVSQMQRFNIFLGHPTLSLSVVLFTLLLSSGLGSLLTNGTKVGFNRATLISLAGLLSSLTIFGLVTPSLIHHFQPAMTWARIVLAIAAMAPLGFFMGMVFPLNMKLAAERWSGAMPWFWGINGAASVCGSVLAVIIAMQWGISAAYWIGMAFYLLAIALFLSLIRPRQS